MLISFAECGRVEVPWNLDAQIPHLSYLAFVIWANC